MDPATLTIPRIRELLTGKEASAREITEAQIARIRERDPEVKAFLTICEERALAQAGRVDEMIARGEELPPLAGVPIAVKDVISTRGVATTAGSRMLEGYVPPYDATAIARLEQAGAVLVGKTNCDEFAMGSSTENSSYFPTRNPHDLTHVPGGSSGGSAAAVAAGMAVAALGSDTGGSIRQPASFCGVLGMLGTYGRVSRYGLIAFGSSLDHIGPLARTTRDAAAVMSILAGPDPMDSTCSHVPGESYLEGLDDSVKGLKIGVPKEYFAEGLNAEVRGKVEKGIDLLREQGCEVREISMPHTPYAIAAYYIVATAEASSNLARYDGVRYGFRAPGVEELDEMYFRTRHDGFGDEVKRRIMLGTYVLSAGYYDAFYRKGQKVRTLIAQDFLKAFEQVDVLAAPTTPTTAFKIGEKSSDPLEMYLSDVYTVTGSLAGVPGLSVPCGTSSEGLPIGLQLLAPYFQEGKLLRLAHAFEKAGGFTL